eukprot:4776410-Ditylum_brightwellii.AAC.1
MREMKVSMALQRRLLLHHHLHPLAIMIQTISNGLIEDKSDPKAVSLLSKNLDLLVWGCPAYVFDPYLQNAKKLHK